MAIIRCILLDLWFICNFFYKNYNEINKKTSNEVDKTGNKIWQNDAFQLHEKLRRSFIWNILIVNKIEKNSLCKTLVFIFFSHHLFRIVTVRFALWLFLFIFSYFSCLLYSIFSVCMELPRLSLNLNIEFCLFLLSLEFSFMCIALLVALRFDMVFVVLLCLLINVYGYISVLRAFWESCALHIPSLSVQFLT